MLENTEEDANIRQRQSFKKHFEGKQQVYYTWLGITLVW